MVRYFSWYYIGMKLYRYQWVLFAEMVYLFGLVLFYFFTGNDFNEAVQLTLRHVPVLGGFVVGVAVVDILSRQGKVRLFDKKSPKK